jgi:hypothetical protein
MFTILPGLFRHRRVGAPARYKHVIDCVMPYMYIYKCGEDRAPHTRFNTFLGQQTYAIYIHDW